MLDDRRLAIDLDQKRNCGFFSSTPLHSNIPFHQNVFHFGIVCDILTRCYLLLVVLVVLPVNLGYPSGSILNVLFIGFTTLHVP